MYSLPKNKIFMNKAFIIFLLLSIGNTIIAQELTLEKVTVVSRHGVRAPLDTYLNTLDDMTGDGYHWVRWSVPGSHLTLRGGALETLFGEYFRLWLDEEHFFDSLGEEDIYFGASSKQRTIATARAFSAGLFPLMTIPIDYKLKADSTIGYLDPDYLPLLNNTCASDGYFDTNAFKQEAYRELGELNAPSYMFLEKILRMKHSQYAKKKGREHFNDSVGVRLHFYNSETGQRLEPTITGGLMDAIMASDAFILQYYELENTRNAAFGRRLRFDDWKKLASIKDYYGHILFSKAPIIAVNISHRMLKRIQSELSVGGHKFAFFCTHDSMIESLLAALRVEEYELPNTIESKTPIGVKLVFEQWTERNCRNPKKYIRIRLLYQSTEQIRGMIAMDVANPPVSFDLGFNGIKKVSNGMYCYDDFMSHLQKSLEAYDASARGQRPW